MMTATVPANGSREGRSRSVLIGSLLARAQGLPDRRSEEERIDGLAKDFRNADSPERFDYVRRVVVDVSGNRDRGYAREPGLDSPCEVDTRHSVKHDVKDHEIKMPWPAEQCEDICCVRGLPSFMAKLPNQLSYQVKDKRVIIDHYDFSHGSPISSRKGSYYDVHNFVAPKRFGEEAANAELFCLLPKDDLLSGLDVKDLTSCLETGNATHDRVPDDSIEGLRNR